MMTNRRMELEFSTSGEVEFKRTVKEIDSSVASLTQAYKLERAELGKKASDYEKYQARLKYVTAAQKEYEDKVKTLTIELNELKNAENKSQTEINKKEKALLNAKTRVVEYSKSIDELNAKIATADWDAAAKKLDKAGDAMTSAGKKASVFSAAFLAAGVKSSELASDLHETMQKTDIVFDESADAVIDWSETSIERLGLAQQTALDLTSTYGDMGTSMGLASDRASELAMSMTERAADLASFKNVGIDRVEGALTAVYTGETEALKGLGIIMTQTNLQNFALSKGITKKIDEMTEAEKVELRYAYVMEKSANAAGDFERNQEGQANSTRIFKETLKQVSTEFGQKLMPIMTSVINKGTDLLNFFNGLSNSTKTVILVIGGVVAAIGPLLLIFGTLAGSISNLMNLASKLAQSQILVSGSAQSMGSALTGAISPILAIIAVIALLVVAFTQLWNENETFRKSMTDAWNGIVSTLTLLWEEFLKPIFESLIGVISNVINTAILPLWDTFKEVLGNIMIGFSELWLSIKPIIDFLILFLGTIIPPIIDTLGAVFGLVFGSISGYISGALKVIEPTIKSMTDLFQGIIDFIVGVFTGDWEKAWQGVSKIFEGIVGGLSLIFKAPLNTLIGLVNGFIGGLNSIQVPDWVPGVGGMGINIGYIPYLASGGNLFGGSAIVGEAGPELLTRTGNSTRVTPLNGSLNEGGLIDYDAMAQAMIKAMAYLKINLDDEQVGAFIDRRVVESL